MVAKVLAKRLQKVLPSIISSDQQGFIQNRYIGFNIRQIQDIIDFTDELDLEGTLLFLDFRKAFDTVEWNFMFETLKLFNFDHTFITCVKCLYTNISTCIYNNGWKSETFYPT